MSRWGAGEQIDKLNRTGKPYYILTNDAAKLPATAAARYQGYGLGIDAERIITSGALLQHHFAAHKLIGTRCVALGPEDCVRYVELAGGRIVSPEDAFDVVVIGDEEGYPFFETVDTVLSALFHKLERQENVHLIAPNPDLIYPKDGQSFGFTSGSIALMFEAVLHQRYPNRPDLHFVRLGKPEPMIFLEAEQRSGSKDMVIIGDQLETDIRGANAFNLDSVLITSSKTALEMAEMPAELRPTYLLRTLVF